MRTCLVVDDSKVVRMVARRILDGLGFQVEEAENGEVALTFCRESMPDVVLLDWNMPVKNGLEFLQEVRALPHADQPVVLFCTMENDVEHIKQALGAGANEYIMKPFDNEILTDKFAQVGLI